MLVPFRRWRLWTRLVVLEAVIAFLMLVAVGSLVLVAQRQDRIDVQAESLEITARVIAQQISRDPGVLGPVFGDPPVEGEAQDDEVIGAIIRTDGTVVGVVGLPGWRSPDRLVPAGALADARRQGEWHDVIELPGAGGRYVAVVAPVPSADGGFVLLARSTATLDGALRRLTIVTLFGGVVALAVAVGGGAWMTRRALAAVGAMTSRAAVVDPDGEHDPIPVPATADELAELARTLNGMVGRLQEATRRERRFTADVSHELRTPLGVAALEIDVALKDPTLPPTVRPVLLSLQAEVAGITDLVNDLLLLARFEAGSPTGPARSPSDLREVCAGAIARARTQAADRGVTLRLSGPSLTASIDALLVRQAVGNLLQNAIGHSPEGAVVEVRIGGVASAARPMARIEVIDQGPGVGADAERIFDRHWTSGAEGDPHRARIGLGLEITRRIAEAHGGTIAVRPGEPIGSIFTVDLPRGEHDGPDGPDAPGDPATPDDPDAAG